MSNLIRYDPFSLDPMADLFQGFFRPMRSLALEGGVPLSDIKIVPDEYREEIFERQHRILVKRAEYGARVRELE